MKKTLLIIALVLVLLVVGLLAYFYFFPRYAQNILIPDIEQLEKVTIKLRGDTARADLQLRISNKGPFKFNIDSLEYHINFDTLRVLSRKQDLDIVLRPGQTDTLHLPVALPYKRLFNRIMELQERDSADITTEARVVYSTIFGKKSFPHKKTNRIGMPRPPRFDVERVRYKKVDKGLILLEVTLRMYNPGNLELMVYDLSYDITVADLLSARGVEKEKIKVKAKSVISRKLPVSVKLDRPLKAGWLILTNQDRVPYNVIIKGYVGDKNESGEKTLVEIESKGVLELVD